MSNVLKQKWAKIFTIFVGALMVIQPLIPTFPIENPANAVIFSAVVMYLVSALTIWKQYLSDAIANASIKVTIWIAVIATIGGLNDLLQWVPLPATTNQWIRVGITVITAILNFISTQLYPSGKNLYVAKDETNK